MGDASRIRLLNPGGRYLKPGTAGDRLVETKQIDYREKLRKYGPPLKPVSHSVVAFEHGGGFCKSAVKWLDDLDDARKAKENKRKGGKRKDKRQTKVEGATWTARDWKAVQAQQISWELSKCTAMGVLAGIKKSVLKQHTFSATIN